MGALGTNILVRLNDLARLSPSEDVIASSSAGRSRVSSSSMCFERSPYSDLMVGIKSGSVVPIS